ncbi:M1 family aminopeptidase [Chondrinema litorale]|uniref:M1 family aminopeptidase n=1 Tax=Chondrinema litorale TaxID=2994555 RepID=UPI0025429187|nr:M1 family aminopeptidase [Chondrinema litorale]UZR96643.1 M1 family aminopeptidase [Chondrinema litorale]
MKHFLLILTTLLLNFHLSFAQVDLAYRCKIEPNVMHTTLSYSPIETDSTTFKYGNLYYGGMKDLMKSFVNLKASVPFKIDTVNSNVIFYHPDNQKIEINYDIIDTHTPEQKVIGEMFRPIISDSYFFSLSHTLFLKPETDKEEKSIIMSVTLEKNPAFPMYFTFAPELKPGKTVKLNLEEGMDALVCGATDLHIETRELDGIKNYIVLRIREDNKYNLDRFMNYFDAFIPAMNDFWGNLEGDYYSLIASPFLDIDYHDISGTAFNNGFHVKYSGDTILANNEVVSTISHEIMHRFIGAGTVSLGTEHQWFDEGFNDYTTWYLLAKSGITTQEDFKNSIEQTYKELADNPVNNTPNSEVMKRFWEGKYYKHLPYQRGAMFAAYLDKRITDLSNGTKSFQDFMSRLKATSEQKEALLTVDDFITVASEFIPKEEIAASLNSYIINGELIPKEKVVH